MDSKAHSHHSQVVTFLGEKVLTEKSIDNN